MAKVVVIGSNSFSGSHFVAHALDAGMEVVGISRSAEINEAFLPYKWRPHTHFKFYAYDLNHNLDMIMAAIRSFRPDYVVNFSAQGMVAQSWERPGDWLMTNTVAMINFHDALRKCDFLKKFVHASTPEVYGNTSGVIRENAPYNPSTPYAISKAACDMSLQAFQKAYDFPVVLTRAANVCGPGQQLYRIIPKTILCILTGEKLRLEGGGTSVRSFIHIRDVCEATLLAARRAKPGEIFHLSTDRRVSIRELVEMICRKMAVSFDTCVEVAEARRGQDAAYLLDSTNAQTELGWKPRISLEEIVSETVDWLKSNLDNLKNEPRNYVHKK